MKSVGQRNYREARAKLKPKGFIKQDFETSLPRIMLAETDPLPALALLPDGGEEATGGAAIHEGWWQWLTSVSILPIRRRIRSGWRLPPSNSGMGHRAFEPAGAARCENDCAPADF